MRLLLTVFLYGFTLAVQPQSPVSRSFELRHFTNDIRANGETDLKGETEWMSLDQRIAFLHRYADHAAAFFNDKDLNTKLVDKDRKSVV